MDEPPEVKQFLQELGEGSRAAPEPGLPEDGLPASGARLPSCGTQQISLVVLHDSMGHALATTSTMHPHEDETSCQAAQKGMHVRVQ